MKNQILFTLGISTALLASSCSKKDSDPAQKVPYANLTTTTNYFNTFIGADSLTTVDFSGQTTRIGMLKELDAYAKKSTTMVIDAAVLKNMYENKNTPFANSAYNTATDKTLVAKTAQSFTTTDAEKERQRFYNFFDSIAAMSSFNSQTASTGQAGLLGGKYLVNAKGFEYAQFIQKGLMGAIMLDQISNIYLGTEKQSADNSALVTGKNYTQLEHHWDEAYGYLTANEYYPKKDPADATKWLESFLGSYVRQVGYDAGKPSAIYLAFLKGRAAVVNKDVNTRNEQIAYIRNAMEQAIGTIAISYLNKTKTATTDADKFHSLSEGTGFVYSLRFAYNAKINSAKSDELLGILMNKTNGFWSLTNADIDNVRDQIATALSIDKNSIVNH